MEYIRFIFQDNRSISQIVSYELNHVTKLKVNYYKITIKICLKTHCNTGDFDLGHLVSKNNIISKIVSKHLESIYKKYDNYIHQRIP